MALSEARHVRRFVAAQHLTAPAYSLDFVAVGWLVIELTGSALSLGINLAVRFLPRLVFAPVVGRIADRLPLRRLLLIVQGLQASASAGALALHAGGGLTTASLLAYVAVTGLLTALAAPTWSRGLHGIGGEDQFRQRYASSVVVVHLTALLGALAGSTLLGTLGAEACFGLEALLHVAAMLVLLGVEPAAWRIDADGDTPPGWHAMVGRVLSEPRLRVPLACLGLMQNISWAYVFFLPSLASDTWRGTELTYRILLAWSGAGAVVGALVGVRAASRPRTAIVAGSSIAAFSLLAAVAPWVHLHGAALCGLSAARILFYVTIAASAMLDVEPAMHGRVAALVGLLDAPFGALLMGQVADHTSMRHVLAVGAICAAALTGWLWLAHAARRFTTHKERQP